MRQPVLRMLFAKDERSIMGVTVVGRDTMVRRADLGLKAGVTGPELGKETRSLFTRLLRFPEWI